MTCAEAVYQWREMIRTHLPTLSRSQAQGLALWSLGVVHTGQCGTSSLATFWAAALGAKVHTLRQRLREWYLPAAQKRGGQRQEVAVRACVPDVVRWALAGWSGPWLTLALDATRLGPRLTVLAVSVVVQGTAIPVHWTVVGGHQKGSWRPAWEQMLAEVWPGLPTDTAVLVVADRGLYAKWLFTTIVRLGGHPLLRVNGGVGGGHFRPAGHGKFVPMAALVAAPGQQWVGAGCAFARRASQLSCTLVARWDAGYADPWLLLTDLAPDQVAAAWYGLRAWIEQGFKFLKSGGWRWDHTRMTDPDRIARHWLVLAVATLQVVRTALAAPGAASSAAAPPWIDTLGLSVARRGWLQVLADQWRGQPLVTGAFHLAPLPALPVHSTSPVQSHSP